jgi:WD40 repeat protein
MMKRGDFMKRIIMSLMMMPLFCQGMYWLRNESLIERAQLKPQDQMKLLAYHEVGWEILPQSLSRSGNEFLAGIRFFVVTPDGKTIAMATSDNRIELVGACKGSLHDQCPTALLFSPDNRYLIAGFDDGKIKVWDCYKPLKTGDPDKKTFKLHACTKTYSGIKELRSSVDGNLLLGIVSSGHKICCWTIDYNQEKAMFQGNFAEKTLISPASTFALSSDKAYTAFGCDQGDIFFVDNIRNESFRLAREHDFAIKSLLFTTDGHCLISASADGTIKKWSIESLLLNNNNRQSYETYWHSGGIVGCALSPNDQHIAIISNGLTILNSNTMSVDERCVMWNWGCERHDISACQPVYSANGILFFIEQEYMVRKYQRPCLKLENDLAVILDFYQQGNKLFKEYEPSERGAILKHRSLVPEQLKESISQDVLHIHMFYSQSSKVM